ncbi:hypothetical protein SPI_03190 [Niveomyces insectorum RCEF 264]|uniref:Uncharacterized protein n=1 Tax=Niveomyces insectorum RCEF 264 TaxID=1081102 RepID=A0A167X580_9HYPO|nr:hypothetical protein SPI_03190 [Niveomyces insectorum RCEF 264]
MSDFGRLFGFGTSRAGLKGTASRRPAASLQSSEPSTTDTTTATPTASCQEKLPLPLPLLPLASFHSLPPHPPLPSRLASPRPPPPPPIPSPLRSEIFPPSPESHASDGSVACAVTTEGDNSSNNSRQDRDQQDGLPGLPPLPATSPDPSSTTTAESTGDAHKAGHHASRPRTLLRASSRWNLRDGNGRHKNNDNNTNSRNSNSSEKERGSDDGGSHAATTLPSPRGRPFSWQTVDKRLYKADDSSSRSSNRGTDRSTCQQGGRSESEVSVPIPPVQGAQPWRSSASTSTLTSTSISSSAPPTATAASAKAPQDWRSWDTTSSDSPYCSPEQDADFAWHKPSFLHIVESLQAGIMASEPASPVTMTPAATLRMSQPAPPFLASPTVAFTMRRRASTAPMTCTTTAASTATETIATGPEHPIPGRYRSHIMHTIEGIRLLQEALDRAEARAREVEAAREHDHALFTSLREEWAAREAQFKQRIRLLEDMTASTTVVKAPPMQEIDRNTGDTPSETIESTTIESFHSGSYSRTRESRAYGAASAEQSMLPALICDLDHDKKVSDQMLQCLAAKERHCFPRERGPKPDRQLPATRSELSVAQERAVEHLQRSMMGSKPVSHDDKKQHKKKSKQNKHEMQTNPNMNNKNHSQDTLSSASRRSTNSRLHNPAQRSASSSPSSSMSSETPPIPSSSSSYDLKKIVVSVKPNLEEKPAAQKSYTNQEAGKVALATKLTSQWPEKTNKQTNSFLPQGRSRDTTNSTNSSPLLHDPHQQLLEGDHSAF